MGKSTILVTKKIKFLPFLESNLGPHSCRVECPECNTHVLSTTTSSPGVKAWVTGIVLCLCG